MRWFSTPERTCAQGRSTGSLPDRLQLLLELSLEEVKIQEVLLSHQLLGWSGSRAASLGVRTMFCWKQLSPAAWQCFFSWMRVTLHVSHWYQLVSFFGSDWTLEYLCESASPLLGGDSCPGQRLWSQWSHSSVGVCLAGVRDDLAAWFPWDTEMVIHGLGVIWKMLCGGSVALFFPNCTYQGVDIFNNEILWCVQRRWIF